METGITNICVPLEKVMTTLRAIGIVEIISYFITIKASLLILLNKLGIYIIIKYHILRMLTLILRVTLQEEST